MYLPRFAATCAALLLLLTGTRAHAQEALVLSGGGSRGLAHVGVLLRLEELGFDPDIVVGNSMGAVIGALYAAGYTPDEIRQRVEAVAWSGMFGAMPTVSGPGQSIRVPMLSFDLNVRERRASRGLFGEWRINRALARLLFDANARARGDFDHLPRRFRALAADLETGEAVVISGGDLARAVRASMAYPGFFAPVEWDDRLLIDGGIVDNLPTLEARDLDAARIVAVDVTRPSERIASRAPLAVVQRALNLMQLNLHRDTITPDVFVQLDIESNFSGTGFPDDPGPLIASGYEKAARHLEGFVTSPAGAPRVLPPAPDTLTSLDVDAPDAALHALATSAFSSIVPGPYDADAVLAALDQLYSSGLVQGVWPRVESERDSVRAATLHVRVDAAAGPSLSVAAGYDNDRGGRLWATFDTYARYGRYPGFRSAAASFTPLERWAAVSTRIHSIARPGLAFTLGAHMQERTARIFGEDITESLEVWRGGGWIGLELPVGLRQGFVTAALRGEWIDPENGTGGAAFGPIIRFAEVSPDIPIVGEPLLFESEVRWGALTYSRFAARGSLSFDIPFLRIALVADARGVSRNAPIDDYPSLGDEHAIPGLRWGEYRGRARAVAGIDAATPVLNGYARVRLRTGGVADRLDTLADTQWLAGGQIGMTWPIPLGLLHAGWGLATRGDGRFIVDLGRVF